MKRLLFTLMLCMAGLTSTAQGIRYWFDADFAANVTLTADTSRAWTADIDVGQLGVGFHTLYLQTADTAGRLDAPRSILFYRLQVPDTAAQTDYWFDNDYSTLSTATGSAMLLDVAGLRNGIHTLSLRTGAGSATRVQNFIFFKQPTSESLEYRYWFDGDYATAVEATSAGNLLIDVSELHDGFHTLYIWFRNGGKAELRTGLFYKMPVAQTTDPMVSYWFDNVDSSMATMPIGNGLVMLDVADLSDTMHTAYIVIGHGRTAKVQSYEFQKVPVNACPGITLPYSENFDDYTTSTGATGVEPTCWELVQEDVAMSADKRPQIYYKSSTAHSGKYSLRLYYRGVYAMPELAEPLETPISQLKLEMYVRQTKTEYMLEVGVWEDDGTFVPVDTVNNQGTGVEHVVCSFAGYTGIGRRIAFRNVMADGSSTKYSANYLDDISLTVACQPITLPYFEDFDSYTTSTNVTGVEPTCWELVQEDVSMSASNRPQLFGKTSYAHSGSYSLRLYYRGVYAMPALDESIEVPISQLQLDMYVRQPKIQNALEVGIWEDNGTFVPVVTVNNQGTGVEHVVCSFAGYTGNGRRIAFRNVMADGSSTKYSANYLDDISLTVACQPITLPYFEDFDSYTTAASTTGEEPTCWELVQEDVAMSASNRPQLFGKASYAHSGSYSLRLYNRGVYAMPALDESLEVPISQLQLDMYVRQPKIQNALEVGIWEDNGTFVPVATVNNQSTGVEHVVCSFAGYTGNGRRIAFRNVMADGSSTKYSANYLDDISLTVACQPITLPYFEDFDSYTASTTSVTGEEPTCWELVQEDVAMSASNRPQLFGKASYAHSGSYSLRLYYRGVYTMPALDESLEVPISQLQLDMYVRQPKIQNALEVGIWEDNGTFVPVATVNNQGTGVEHVVCSFAGYTGNGRRIAFRNVMADGSSTKYSANYLDDISITTVASKGKDIANTDNDTDALEEMAADLYLRSITLYPNPTAGIVHIDAVEVQRVECYTMTGQKVAVFDGKRDIDISQFAAGVYMLRIIMPEGEIMRKVVRK